MPADDGLGLDDGERFLASRPPATQLKPEDSIGGAETKSRLLPSEDSELPSGREVLQDRVGNAHVPVVRRQTRMPVCVDASHSFGTSRTAPGGLPDIFHVTEQGIVAGASMVLVDVHPVPEKVLCDGPQTPRLEQVPRFVKYVRRVRACYDEVTRSAWE
jgi:hypothetical protein